jgi:putative transposase
MHGIMWGMQKLRRARVALYRSRRGISNDPGNVAIYLLRTLRGDHLEEIGRDFNISRFISVSSIVERVRYEMKADRGLKKRIQNLAENITRSQLQTSS